MALNFDDFCCTDAVFFEAMVYPETVIEFLYYATGKLPPHNATEISSFKFGGFRFSRKSDYSRTSPPGTGWY